MDRESSIEQAAHTVARDAAIAAGKLVLKYWPHPLNRDFDKNLVMEIFRKEGGTGNYATIADLESERLIRHHIESESLVANHRVLGEELAANERESDWQWIIDPIDGTQPFRNGLPEFGVSIGVLKNNQPLIGVIAMPAYRQLILAHRNAGASLLSFDGTVLVDLREMSVENRRIEDMLIGYDTGYENRAGQLSDVVSRVSDHVGNTVSYGSAAVANFRLALGQLGGYFHKKVTRFDIAAASAIIEEIGGTVSTIEGAPIDWHDESPSYLAARDPETHRELLSLLQRT